MSYDVNFVSEGQRKKAQHLIDLVVECFNLGKIPEHKIFGFNFTEMLTKLEIMKTSLRGGALKDIESTIRYIGNNSDVILVLYLENHLKKLVYSREFLPTSKKRHYEKSVKTQDTWTGVLDFSIPQAFLFGRVAKRERHGGGNYCFTSFNHEKMNFEKIIEKSGHSLDFLLEQNYFLSLLNKFRYNPNAIASMKMGYQKYKSKKTSDDYLINQLNRDSLLLKSLKKISHFGNSTFILVKYVSDCDISTFFFPYKNKTIFQVCDHSIFVNKKTILAINTLIKRLINFDTQ